LALTGETLRLGRPRRASHTNEERVAGAVFWILDPGACRFSMPAPGGALVRYCNCSERRVNDRCTLTVSA